MTTRSLTTVAVAALAAAGLVLGVNAAAHIGRTPSAAPAAAAVPPDVAAADKAAAEQGLPPRPDVDEVPDLSTDLIAKAKAVGWDVTVETPAGRLAAQDVANRHAAVGLMHADIAGLSLARVTIHGYGDPIDPSNDSTSDADLRLKVQNQVYFVAVARQAPMPVGGPQSAYEQRVREGNDSVYEAQDVIMLIEPGKDRPAIVRTLAAG